MVFLLSCCHPTGGNAPARPAVPKFHTEVPSAHELRRKCPLPLRERAAWCVRNLEWVRGWHTRTPHPFECLDEPELPSPARGEGAIATLQLAAGMNEKAARFYSKPFTTFTISRRLLEPRGAGGEQ